MGRDKHSPFIHLKEQGKEIPGIHSKNGPPIGSNVAPQTLKPGVKNSGGLKIRQYDQVMNLADIISLLVNSADLPGKDKAGRFRSSRQRQPLGHGRPGVKTGADFVFQHIETLFSVFHLAAEFMEPLRMGTVSGSQEGNAFDLGPPFQGGRAKLRAGSAGIGGMDVESATILIVVSLLNCALYKKCIIPGGGVHTGNKPIQGGERHCATHCLHYMLPYVAASSPGSLFMIK